MMQERNVLICSVLHHIASAKKDMIKWSKKVKEKSENRLSLFFPVFPCCSLVLWSMANTSYFCRQKRALRRNTKRNYKQNNNKIMGYFIITDSNWAKLRNEILALAETCHKAFGDQSRHTDWLHNGDVCRLLNISKRTLQNYRDRRIIPYTQFAGKILYKQGRYSIRCQI